MDRIPQPPNRVAADTSSSPVALRPTRKVTGQTIRCQISAAKNGAASTAQGRKSPRLQLGVLIHRQSILTDEGAAQKHLPWNAQQILTGLGGEDAGDGVGGAGVGETGVTHGGGGPSGLPQEGIAGIAVPQQ